MLIININGAINSGKSTVSKILAQHLKSSCFIEVDDLLSDEEQSVLGLNRKEGWQERIKRLQRIIEAEKRNRQYENIVFANTFIIFYFTLFNQICIHKTDELWEIIVCLFQISATHF